MSLSNLGLDAFLAVHHHKTVLEASKHLNISQTGVTQRIRALEKQLDTTLFIRSRKGMKLTDSGSKLLTYCKQRSSLENDIVSQIKNEAISNPVRITFSASTFFMQDRVLGPAKEVKANYPELYFSFNVNDNDDKIRLLKQSQADFIFLPRENVPLECDSKLLSLSEYILVGNPKAQEKIDDCTIIDFSPRDNFTELFFERLKIDYKKSKERHYMNNTLMLPKLLEDGLGVAVLDKKHYLEIKSSYDIIDLFPGMSYKINWALVWLPRPEMPTYFKEIIQKIT